MKTGLAAINSAESSNGGSQGGSVKFFHLADGESCTIRLLTGIDNMVVYTHHAVKGDGTPCNAHLLEIGQTDWDEIIAAGQRPICPVCGQPIMDTDIDYIRPGIMEVGQHTEMVNGNRTLVYCMDSLDDDSHNCPLCTHTVEFIKRDGSHGTRRNNPAKRYMAWCVLREKHTSQSVNAQGMPMTVVDGIEDVMEDVDGVMRPAIRLINMGYKNFWSHFHSFWNANGAVGYYDFDITRSGSTTDTVYNITCVDMNTPVALDMRQYEEDEPLSAKLEGFVRYMSSPEYYVSKGIHVPGYVSPEQVPPEQANAYSAPMNMNMTTSPKYVTAENPPSQQWNPSVTTVPVAPASNMPVDAGNGGFRQTPIPQSGTPWNQVNTAFDA